jgi:hypothetical protein
MNVAKLGETVAPEPQGLRGARTLDGTKRPIVKIVPERRKHRRVEVSLQGRFLREDKQEYACEVINMSAGGMAVRAAVTCEVGERIVAYLDHLGRIEGVVVREIDGEFAARIVASQIKRERIANLLTWLTNQKTLGLSEERRHERFVPRVSDTKLILPNGDVHSCRVIDISLSGASVAAGVKPGLETVVILGRMRGRVVRHHDQGFAIQFAELQDPDSLTRAFS